MSLASTTGLAELSSLSAPGWVRARLWDPKDLDDLAEACDTLGAGLVDDTGSVPVGAWLFGDHGVDLVIAIDAAGRPALVLGPDRSAAGARLRWHSGARAERVWIPSVQARVYVADPAGGGYADRNRLVGMVKRWGLHKAELDSPLFAQSELWSSGAFSPDASKILKRGPATAEEWPDYLAQTGALEPGPPRPGDLLVFKEAERQAIALDEDAMLVLTGDRGRVGIRPIRDVTGRWRLEPT